MSEAKILGFPLKGSAQPVLIREGEPGYISPDSSPGSIAEIEEMVRQSRHNAAAFLNRNIIFD